MLASNVQPNAMPVQQHVKQMDMLTVQHIALPVRKNVANVLKPVKAGAMGLLPQQQNVQPLAKLALRNATNIQVCHVAKNVEMLAASVQKNAEK